MVWNGMEPWVLFRWSGRQSISYLTSSNNSHPSNNSLPQITLAPPQPLWPFSLSFILSLLLFSYYSRKYGIVWNSWYFSSTTYTQQEYCIFSVPTAVSKLLYFITLQCTSWLNHLLSSRHKYCTSTYCLKYNFFRVLHNLAKCPLPKVMLYEIL